jgi:peptidyl-prolyl cis-trans isomerase SurA
LGILIVSKRLWLNILEFYFDFRYFKENNLSLIMRKLVFVFLLLPVLAFSQKSASNTLLTIDDQSFSKEEFMYVYNKNNSNPSSVDQKSVNEYLDLYINFRLKVKEAEDRGMDTTMAFKRELKGYRDQLARPYLTDKSVDSNILKEAYDRLKWDIRASHIMIAVDEDVSKNDTVAVNAYKKLVDIRKQILNGASFTEMAKKYSDDPSARDMPASRYRGAHKGNGGDLGYFTAFYMVYPFETAAYNTPVGEISMPIRTKYGYHIIKVTDKIPELGKIEVKHINVKPKSSSDADKAVALSKIKEIQAKINSGELSFEEAAKQYSDDKGSIEKGGLLPAFEVSRMVPEFIQAISILKVDEVSEPVFTEYGWHLIKLVRLIKMPSYEEYLPTIKSKVSRDSRSNMSQEAAIAKFKKEYKFKEYPKSLTAFYSVVDSSIYTNTWTADKANNLTKVLFKLDGKKYYQKDFAKYVAENQVMKHKGTLRYFTDKLYNKWVDKIVLDYKDSKLESENIDFKMLVQEYHDGILLFAISDTEVWGKAIKDSTGLAKFYEQNKQKYLWKERVDASLYKCSSDSIAKLVKSWLAKDYSLDTIMRMANHKSALNLRYEKGKYEAGDNSIIDEIEHKVGVSDIIMSGKSYVVVSINEIVPPQPKSLDEARGLITADYQNYLEEKWIEKLHKDHTVKVNRELLN